MPLDRSDVDTDQIIPSEWLKRVERTGFGEGLFAEWRDDRDFVLNQPEHAGATILVAGPNFGTGSSREHAVWALAGLRLPGRRVAPLRRHLPQQLPPRRAWSPCEVDARRWATALMAAVRGRPDARDHRSTSSARTAAAPAAGIEAPFPLDDFTRMRLLEGLDDIGLTERHRDEIAAFEQSRAEWLPTA